MKSLRYYYKKIVRPYGKCHFLSTYVGKKQAKILDVGCGIAIILELMLAIITWPKN